MTTNPDRTTTCPDCGCEIGPPLVCLGRLCLTCSSCGNEWGSLEAIKLAWTAKIMLDRGVLA